MPDEKESNVKDVDKKEPDKPAVNTEKDSTPPEADKKESDAPVVATEEIDAAKKEPVTPVITTADVEVLQQTETVIVFKVTRPLMTHEYEELSARVRAENQASGIKIVLAPAIVDEVEISG
jgi:hypothetical protein